MIPIQKLLEIAAIDHEERNAASNPHNHYSAARPAPPFPRTFASMPPPQHDNKHGIRHH